ncbi:unnamed protein product [Heligmosomoides polygyrus]|uniref:Very-long-chain 3-oxoacyl-CoA synthase n=1 Tax=Heligmosomoides polygyrus TaxID=6339 RepID=A0A3P8DFA0_HELPZ|nr:unnamed protein product [Heligmosomoides polygyrus]
MISLAVPPYTCCCTFLPDLKPTLNNFLRIDACILQTVIVRVLLQVCELVTYFELRNKNHVFFTLSNLTNIVSMYISLYFGYVLVNAGKAKLEPPYRAGVLFKLHDYLLSAPAILKLILDIAVAMDWIGPQKLMPADSIAMFYFNFLLILENLVISVYATYVFRPTQILTNDEAQKNKKSGSGSVSKFA